VREASVSHCANASESVKEPGIARFDVIQQNDDPTRFILVEVTATPKHRAPQRHEHYQTWRDAVADMMAEPRISYKYSNAFPATRAGRPA
jgi:quinol monooxygenase YgiN